MSDKKSAAQSSPDDVSRNETDRLAQAVDDEGAPRLSFPVIGIGASAGGLEAFIEFFKAVPPQTNMAFVLIQHLSPDRESMIADILSKNTVLPVEQVEDGVTIRPDHVYVIRPGRTMTIRNGRLHLGEPLEKPGHRRPVDDFFRSLAEEQRERAVCVIFSGMGSNGTAGAQAVKAVGGVCIAQDPDSAKFPSMPRTLIDAGLADFVLRPEQVPEVLINYTSHPYAREHEYASQMGGRERTAFTEILSLLRTRAKRDFTGYKQPTVVRRIQRRMSLHQQLSMDGYAKLLRNNLSEATALSDDLVIHVTGFFRDADAWETLRKRVIEPMVGEREPGSPVRAWVTACSSGEEAYTIAMLIVEASEAAHKQLDIKIFATDLAERTLVQARSGVYPQGIEGEITPDRLERFFEKDEQFYRVRKELRELIVFSPQNILQDPPFSRLDLCTCRNLMIYLEPEVQRRVLGLLHFGLREGAALMLGNSETISGAEELFEPIDKKWRIYRRVGLTRYDSVGFPAGPGLGPRSGSSDLERMGGRNNNRASLTHQLQRTLLDRFTPPAVVIDRQYRVVLFHGDTSPFLTQPAGEPTRELLAMAREGVRGAVRVALHAAMVEGKNDTSRDGFIDTAEVRTRVAVHAAPLDDKPEPAFFLVTFEKWTPPTLPDLSANGTADGATDRLQLIGELQRVRDELQSTVEELQTSNEELKASNEEVTSVNEELQSTNEELETSKEELQSLNEELTTVNAQLQAKMEELEGTGNDLSSLLSSTDIAVVFLDMQFRIRRYTPAVRDLFDLIPTDLGRPLSDLSPKFTDPDLLADARAVLARLIPVEREVVSTSRQWYVRRVLPYRTVDNRIDGVVVTFVDITRRRAAELSQRESEQRYRLIVQGVREYAIFLIDPKGVITVWNVGAERVLGYAEAEAVGEHSRLIFTLEDRAGGEPEKELERAARDGQTVDERWHVRKDGQRFWGSGMVTAIRKDNGELAGFVKVMRDNTDRKLSEDQLHAAQRSAEAANHAKDQFLATVSHELRTPLTAILLWTQMMHASPSPEIMHEGLEAIEHSALSQKQLIDDLLDTSRISAGKLRINLRPTDLTSVARQAIETIQPTAAAKDVTIGHDFGDDVGTVLADADRLQQVIWNVLSNAVKFTPAGGRVDVGLWRRGNEVEVRVTDTGKGVDPAFLPMVFDRFRQAEGVNTRSQGGLGLGLAISKQLVELHGGSVELTSPGLNQGATVTIRLPLSRLPGAIAKIQTSAQSLGAQTVLADRHILLLEDNTQSNDALTAMLKSAGANVTSVRSASSALGVLKSTTPDVIISDIAMPDMDGLAFLEKVRAQEAKRHERPIPAIAISAFTRDEDRDRATAAGFQAYVSKPIHAPDLIGQILNLIRRER